jgi:nucleotide-binding universal stress UspA family protein
MLSIKKILLPLDFQEASVPVVHQVATLARHFRSEVVLAHVVTPLSYAAGMLPGDYVPINLDDLHKQLIRAAQNNLDNALGSELAGLTVSRVLLEGDPANEIVKAARDEKADLIGLPTHGYGGFRRFLLGSVTAKVLHDSEIPVWTAAHIAENPAREFTIRQILCAIDLSEHSARTLKVAAELASEFNARLTLANITPVDEVYIDAISEPDTDWKLSFTEAAKGKVAQLQKEAGTTAEVYIGHGDVPVVLHHAAKQTKADVLVMGRHASGARLHSTGYGIIRESPIPVLSI